MDKKEFLEYLREGEPVAGDPDLFRMMHELAAETLRETAELSSGYHEPEEMRRLFSKVIGKKVDDSIHKIMQ